MTVPPDTPAKRPPSGMAAVHAKKTHCPQGHPYSGDNLLVFGGQRCCRECRRLRGQARRRARWSGVPRVFVVYRAFDAAGRLLYVGLTDCLPRRLAQHAENSIWWPRAANTTATTYDTRREARHAEAAAICDEAPLFNDAGRPVT